jgi:hypothetical protein
MFNRDDYKALITTAVIIVLGYALIHLFVFLDDYFKLTLY